MRPTDSKVRRRFGGKRIFIPVLAVGLTLFLVLGGHHKISSAVVDGVAGFLSGTDGAPAREPSDRASSQGSDSPAAPLSGSVAGRTGAAEVSEVAVSPIDRAPEGVDVVGEASVEEGEGTGNVADVAWADDGSGQAETRPDADEAQAGGIDAEAALVLAQAEPAPVAGVTQAPADTAEAESLGTAVVRQVVKVYTASFLRDPFYSLILEGKAQPTKLLDVSRAKMVGSVWGELGIIALLEDDLGRSYALKVGDRVVNGRVISVTPASVTFSITMFGLTKTVTLELAEEGEW